VTDQATRRAHRLSLELKYAAIAVTIVLAFLVLHAAGAFNGVNDTVTEGVDRVATFGLIGIFVIALVANLSILVQIPYTLPLLSAALGGASLQSMLGLGLASGLGAGIGAVASYKVADALVTKSPRLPEGRWFRWIAHNVDDRPRATACAIFLVGLSPLPDGAVVVPLAVVHYGMRRLAVPLSSASSSTTWCSRCSSTGSPRGRPTTCPRRRAQSWPCSWRRCSWFWSATTPRRRGPRCATPKPAPNPPSEPVQPAV
jgi:hypothetical protein